MKLFANTCEFNYSWDQVTAANWQKYPNEISTHVIAVDVLRRELDTTGKILTTERLITCKQSIPRWLNTLIGGEEVSYVREVSVVDMNTKTLTLRSVNLTMSHLLKVYETVYYTPDESNPYKTKFNQRAEITAYGSWSRLCNKLEEWGVDRFGQNAIKGKLGFESILDVLCPKEVTEVINENIDLVKTKTTELIQDADKVLVKTLEKTEELIHDADEAITKTIEKTEEIINDSINEGITKRAESIFQEADGVLVDTFPKTDHGILTQYYDYFKSAFKK